MAKVKLATGELREPKHVSDYDLERLACKALVEAEAIGENLTDLQRDEFKRRLIIYLLGGSS